MKLLLLGTGEAFDSEWGNNACLAYGTGLPTVLFDCGYQIPERLWRQKKLYPALDTVFFTHLHADHSFGFVPLIARFKEEKRKAPLRILAPRGGERFFRRLLELGYPTIASRLPFPLIFQTVAEGEPFSLGSLTVRTARSGHPILNLSVRVEKGPKSFGISGDGQLTPATRELFRGVDLLLHEVYSATPQVPSHCDLVTLQQYADGAGIRRIGITHTGRAFRAELARAIGRLRRTGGRAATQWFLGEPGMTFTAL